MIENLTKSTGIYWFIESSRDRLPPSLLSDKKKLSLFVEYTDSTHDYVPLLCAAKNKYSITWSHKFEHIVVSYVGLLLYQSENIIIHKTFSITWYQQYI